LISGAIEECQLHVLSKAWKLAGALISRAKEEFQLHVLSKTRNHVLKVVVVAEDLPQHGARCKRRQSPGELIAAATEPHQLLALGERRQRACVTSANQVSFEKTEDNGL
jgi:hypothetical protein